MTDRQGRPEGRDGWERAYHWFSREAVPALGLTAPQIAVYNALRDRADARGQCHPSQDTIARESGVSVRAARAAVDRLADVGLIVVHRGTRQGNRYRLARRPHLQAIEAPAAAMCDCEPVDNSTVSDAIAAPTAGHCGTSCRSIAARGAYEEDPLKKTHEKYPGNGHRGRPSATTNRPTGKQLAHLADLRAAMHDLEDDDDRVLPPATVADADDLIRLYRSEQHRRIHNGEPFDCSLDALSADGRRYFTDRDLTDLFDLTAAVSA